MSPYWNRIVLVWLLLQQTAFSISSAHTAEISKGSCDVTGTIHHKDSVCDASADLDSMCTLYLAESSIPGAGLGIFTTIDRDEDDLVGRGDVNLPLVDYNYHIRALGISEQDWRGHNPNFAFDYIWFAANIGINYESANPYDDNYAFAPGLDAAINCHFALLNTEKVACVSDPLDLHRSKDPGVGAYTPYFNSTTWITHYVPAGGELFKDYGEHYFSDRPQLYPDFPLIDDHRKAGQLLRAFDMMMQNHRHLPEQVVTDAWKLVTEFPLRSPLLNAVPSDAAVATKLARHGTSAAWQPFFTRDVGEIKRSGRCLDIIDPKPSTIRQAGRGAFAAAFIHEGNIITGSPLMFIPTLDFFTMYDGDWHNKGDHSDREKLFGYQIILNYCFHHSNASVYLCPYGSGINFINHNKTLANVKLKWAKNGEMGHNETLFTTDPDTLKFTPAPGLFLDYVATRDILPGEELFMDYGDEWEQAWIDHEHNWNNHGRYDEDYVSAFELNQELDGEILLTIDEQKEEGLQYPENVLTHCFNRQIIPEIKSDRALEIVFDFQGTLECEILDRYENDEGDIVYTVGYCDPYDEEFCVFQEGIPRSAIRFVDIPYSTDLWLPDAFRHPIMLPDELLPDFWRGRFLTLP